MSNKGPTRVPKRIPTRVRQRSQQGSLQNTTRRRTTTSSLLTPHQILLLYSLMQANPIHNIKVDHVLAMIQDGSLVLDFADYRRGDVWSKVWKRCFIQSTTLNQSTTPILVNIKKEYNKRVLLDGKQRILAIQQYVNRHYPFDNETDEKTYEKVKEELMNSMLPFQEVYEASNTEERNYYLNYNRSWAQSLE